MQLRWPYPLAPGTGAWGAPNSNHNFCEEVGTRRDLRCPWASQGAAAQGRRAGVDACFAVLGPHWRRAALDVVPCHPQVPQPDGRRPVHVPCCRSVTAPAALLRGDAGAAQELHARHAGRADPGLNLPRRGQRNLRARDSLRSHGHHGSAQDAAADPRARQERSAQEAHGAAGLVKHHVGLPWGFLFELHGWWHIFTGIGAYIGMALTEYLVTIEEGKTDRVEEGYTTSTATAPQPGSVRPPPPNQSSTNTPSNPSAPPHRKPNHDRRPTLPRSARSHTPGSLLLAHTGPGAPRAGRADGAAHGLGAAVESAC
ncbi:hypothetical protein OPT61_g9576 [Boeremia exigua]|uniref:Uncharacterized protein n=1 Tax=Boeremia exigua TaxID=749465 RepID=A0ACC2HU11_9PLEO|nr:hypothetical protein OPT61_g9576 [Boeremia exigua]